MREVRVSAYVAEDVALSEHVHISEVDELKGWLYIGEGGEVALWGPPAGLRRLAAALVVLAERAEGLADLRRAATAGRDGADRHVELSGVRGS